MELFGIVGSAGARAQSYPNKPITIVAAYPPGGVGDVVARVLATEHPKRFGKPVTVENKTGPTGMIGERGCTRRAGRAHVADGCDGQTMFNQHLQDQGAGK